MSLQLNSDVRCLNSSVLKSKAADFLALSAFGDLIAFPAGNRGVKVIFTIYAYVNS